MAEIKKNSKGEIIKTYKICEFGKKSKRGFYFRKKTVLDFLETAECKQRLHKRTGLCTITHKGRKTSSETNTKNLGLLDWTLIDRTAVGTVIDLYVKGNSWMVDVLIFNSEDFEGPTREAVTFITGLMKAGVKLDISAGIDAYYDPVTKEGSVIYDVIGVDFTQHPDFNESEEV